jgi:hypothetical protein
MQKKMIAIRHRKSETAIMTEPLNSLIYKYKKFNSFYTDCGEPNTAKFPLFDVMTTIYNSHGKFRYQEHFSFLRTAGGYKLIEVAWKSL